MNDNNLNENIDPNYFLEKFISDAQNKLDQEKVGKLRINRQEYKEFLQNIANRNCPQCGKELKILSCAVKRNSNVDETLYEFSCGHKHHEVRVSEEIKINEKIKGKMAEKGKKPHLTFLHKTEPGINPKSIDGVEISWTADRRNNIWKHIIKDIKTGKILHDENMPLDQHR